MIQDFTRFMRHLSTICWFIRGILTMFGILFMLCVAIIVVAENMPVGRAVYFLPVNFIPGYGSLWHAVLMAERESPHEMARHNAMAGVSYAFAMVNLSHPQILEGLLEDHGKELEGTAFADGLVAAVVMRHEITPDAPELYDFIDHPAGPKAAKFWRDFVRDPCRGALGLDGGGGDWLDRQVADVYRSLPRAHSKD